MTLERGRACIPRPRHNAIELREEMIRSKSRNFGLIDGGVILCGETGPIHRPANLEARPMKLVDCKFCDRTFIEEKIFIHHRNCSAENPMKEEQLEKKNRKERKIEDKSSSNTVERVEYDIVKVVDFENELN